MPFQVGNVAGRNTKIIDSAIRRIMAKDNGQKLLRAVERVLSDAADGETWQQRHAALAWLADRVDGKAVARVETQSDDVRAMSMGELALLIMQARAAEATDVGDVSANLPDAIENKASAHQLGDSPHAISAEIGGGGTVGGPHSQVPTNNPDTLTVSEGVGAKADGVGSLSGK